jgi:hypothetical protein
MTPLFCQGKDIQRETSAAVGIGARLIPTAEANSYFRPGVRVFISEPDATEVEFLGAIQSVASDSITVELATQAAKNEGAKLWTPLAVFEWPAGAAGATRRIHQGGVEVVRSLGGVAYATRLHSPCETENVRFDNLTDERFELLSSLFTQQANDGLEEFTYVDDGRAVWRVRLEAPTLESSRNARDLVVVGFNLHLLDAASYV